MKVLDLQCGHGHGFEGWFGNEADFQDQQARGLVTCPLCADGQISKLPSSPRLNLRTTDQRQRSPEGRDASPSQDASSHKVLSSPEASDDRERTGDGALPPELQTLWVRALREVMARTEDVGPQFPEQALRMHHGEEAVRPIRGQATPEEARVLRDEGVDILPLPDFPGLKQTLQ